MAEDITVHRGHVTFSTFSGVFWRGEHDRQRLDAYLYGHTTVVEAHESDGDNYAILRSDAEFTNALALQGQLQQFYNTWDAAEHNAKYQVGRLQSGLFAAEVCGTYEDALQWCVSRISLARR